MLTLSEAKRIIEGAIVEARKSGANISVAVCDIQGQLIASNRMDGAPWDVNHGSIGKAIAAAMTGHPSEELAGRLTASGRHFALSGKLVAAQGRRGGLPIIKGGVVEGGCGVSGAHTNEQDEEYARAGIEALNIAKLDMPQEPVVALTRAEVTTSNVFEATSSHGRTAHLPPNGRTIISETAVSDFD